MQSTIHAQNERRITVLRTCIEYIFDNKVADARKVEIANYNFLIEIKKK